MNRQLLSQLRKITDEEQKILDGDLNIQKNLYTSGDTFVIDCDKFLKKGKLIDIRPHTRFIHFPSHKHNYVEMVYMCTGHTTHIINGKEKIVLQEGDLLFMNQNATHEILPASEDDIAVNFIIMPEFFHYAMKVIDTHNILFEFIASALSSKQNACDYLHFRTENILPVQNLLENMIWTIQNRHACRNAVNQLTMGLLFLNLMEFTEVVYQDDSKTYEQNLVFSSLRYVKSHYQGATLEELAESLHLPPYALSRILKRYTGCNFKELLIKQKMEEAAYLLSKTSLSTEAILHSIGYENSSFFHRKFKEIYGKTPREFRKEQTISGFTEGFAELL